MYNIWKILPSRFHDKPKLRRVALISLLTLIFLCVIALLTTPILNFLGPKHPPKTANKGTSVLVRRINAPYIGDAAVPFNQAAIFWFGLEATLGNVVTSKVAPVKKL